MYCDGLSLSHYMFLEHNQQNGKYQRDNNDDDTDNTVLDLQRIYHAVYRFKYQEQ